MEQGCARTGLRLDRGRRRQSDWCCITPAQRPLWVATWLLIRCQAAAFQRLLQRDITRNLFPINGAFSAEQRALY